MTSVQVEIWDSLNDAEEFGYGEAWDEDWTRLIASGVSAYFDHTGTPIDGTLDDTWQFVWTCRRQLWREAISEGRARVEFSHRAASGTGTGPNLTLESDDNELRLTSEFEFSWQLSAKGFEGWEEFQLEILNFEEVDHQFYENAFNEDSRLVVVTGALAKLEAWTSLPPAVRDAALMRLLQMPDWEETRDVLCLIAEMEDSAANWTRAWAHHSSPLVRWVVAARASTTPDILMQLACDPEPSVREAVICNPNATEEARAAATLENL